MGYIDFSGNWNRVPEGEGISKRVARNIVGKCKEVQTFIEMPGDRSGAVIVAATHKTQSDHKSHLTVRLYKEGKHVKSCHVYVDKGRFQRCNCKPV